MIRKAVPSDIGALVDMGNAFFVETGWNKHAPFDNDSFGYSCGALMESGLLQVTMNKDERVVGMIASGFAPAYWNRKVATAQELWFYVEPEWRNGLGGELMRSHEDEQRQRGVFLSSMSAEEGLRGPALDRLYKRKGYFPMERLYWKVLA